MKTGEAHAPAAISNFFTVNDAPHGHPTARTDLHSTGAMGGGYMLSKGVRSRVEAVPLEGASKVARVIVDGDPRYDATTTRTALEMLLATDAAGGGWKLDVSQTMEVPVGQGFGASAAAALSAVNAAASALRIGLTAEEVAYFAHAADILCRTGLGTVSVTYRYGGAGVIVKPGSPGVAEVRQVGVPADVRVVTASLAPYSKGPMLSSPVMKAKVNRLGLEALRVAEDLTLESLVRAGELFSQNLGLESEDVGRLIEVARSSGAIGASQNMVGHAIHALVWEENVSAVASALRADRARPLVGVYGFGKARRAH